MTTSAAFERGQIVWLLFNPQRGHEQAGHRPAVVISPKDYNAVSSCVIVCPITSNTAPWPWKVNLPADLGVSGSVLVDQAKSLDLVARKAEPSGVTVPPSTMDEILARLATLTG